MLRQTGYNRLFNAAFDQTRSLVPLLILFAMLLFAARPAAAQDVMSMDSMGGGKAQVSTVWLHDQAKPAGQNVLAVVLDVEPNWHIASDAGQAVESGFSPVYTSVRVTSEDARLTFGPAQFPKAKLLPMGGLPDPISVFDGKVVVYLPVTIATDAELGNVDVKVKVDYQACDDKTCDFPQTENLSTSFTIVGPDEPVAAPSGASNLFKDFDPAAFEVISAGAATESATKPVPIPAAIAGTVDFYFFEIDPSGGLGFALLLLLAAIGGTLLNFTPCVLPVIPIKILGLAQTAGNRKRTLALGSTMALGVVAFWLGLGIAIAGVSGFTASNQLFQYPWFSITVGVIIAVMAVGMCGLFAIRLPNFVYSVSPKHDSYPGSFGFGVMTAVLSTPCTAPLMGAAAAWAATQKPSITLATFIAIGVGMALPYFILSANPKLVDALPRSGPGSELLKQVMGLFMLAAAAFFVGAGVSGMMSDGTEAAPKGHWWVVAGFVAAAGLWLMIRVFQATPSPVKRGAFAMLGVCTIVVAGVGALALTEKSDGQDAPINWVYYTPERFEQALADGQVVLLDFTADWCANCHLLEHTVLNTDAVTSVLDDEGYVAMKVDLTGGYPDGKLKLKETGSVTIPWLVVFAPDGEVVFRADWYTATQITGALAQAKQPALASTSD
jgi:thiol:disulfide interchange protein DsbD